MVLPHHGEDVGGGKAWVLSISQSQQFPSEYVVTSGDLLVVWEVPQSVNFSHEGLTVVVNVALGDLIGTEGPVFLPDEVGPGVTALTDVARLSLVTQTVTLTIAIVAEWNTDATKASLCVETLLVLRTDCRVPTLVNISAGLVVVRQLVAGQTADEGAGRVEAGVAVDTARTLLTLVNISASLPVISQLVARQAAPPAPHCVDTKLLLTAVVDIFTALVNVPALLAFSQPLVTRLAGWKILKYNFRQMDLN